MHQIIANGQHYFLHPWHVQQLYKDTANNTLNAISAVKTYLNMYGTTDAAKRVNTAQLRYIPLPCETLMSDRTPCAIYIELMLSVFWWAISIWLLQSIWKWWMKWLAQPRQRRETFDKVLPFGITTPIISFMFQRPHAERRGLCTYMNNEGYKYGSKQQK